jgi:hypothetical protein
MYLKNKKQISARRVEQLVNSLIYWGDADEWESVLADDMIQAGVLPSQIHALTERGWIRVCEAAQASDEIEIVGVHERAIFYDVRAATRELYKIRKAKNV